MAVVFANYRLFWLLSLAAVAYGAKLNVPRVLLPVFNTVSTGFDLEVTEAAVGGCFKWSTTRPDLIEITPLDQDNELGCSFRSSISVITRDRVRNIAVVIVEDIMTKQVLRCDIIVDVIHKLGIITKTKELFMNEAPEGFYVAAYDEQGNEFSSLQGVEIDWQITCLGPKRSLEIVSFMLFKDSPYEAPPGISELENDGRRGYVALLRGIRTGSAKISVQLPHVEYSQIYAFEFQISIVANLIISPMDVYIMAGDKVPFRIFHMNNGLLEEIKLPSIQYYFDVEMKTIASADLKTGEVTGLQEGRTKVFLHDKNVDENDPNLRLPAAVLNVVTPAYMTLRMLPYNNWNILLGDHHDIVADVYASNDHKLYLGPGVKIHMSVEEHFHIQQLTTNGSWLTGWAKLDGRSKVHAVLKAVVHKDLGQIKIDPEITAKNEIIVHPRIILTPSEVILPWDDAIRPKYNIPLEVTGGDEKFLWSSSDHSIGVVSQSGMVRTHSKGHFEVSAAMQKNHYNRQTAKFHILPPGRLEIVEFAMNAEVGQLMYLHIALYAEKTMKDNSEITHIPFTQCQDLPFKVQTTDYNFVQNKTAVLPPIGIACANIAVVGHDIGTSKVLITYKNEDIHLEDSVTLSTFKTLKLAYPLQDEVVLAVGTSLELLFTGGPRPSPSWPNEFKRTAVSSFPELVQVEDITDPVLVSGSPDYIALRVLCRKLGESYVVLSVVNYSPIPNCKNQETVATVKVICGRPRMVSLQPEIKVADAHSCPMDLSAERVVVQSYNDIELDVTVYDDAGRKFFNASSLEFIWDLQLAHLGDLHLPNGVFSRYTNINNYVVGNKSYQVITPKAQTGIVNVTAEIIGYNKKKLQFYGITAEYPPFLGPEEKNTELQPIYAAISLVLVDDTIVSENILYLYNHPANKRRLLVTQGSGFYEVSMSTKNIAEVKYLDGTRELEIKPLNDGELHVNLVDLCLISRPAAIVVHVVSVHNIKLEMPDKVEIKKCISCIVRLYDENDNLLDIPDLDMIQLKARLDREIVSIKRVDEVQRDDQNRTAALIKYIITGIELGDTKLKFVVGGTDISSAPMDLQVFPPLKLYPRNSTLLLGTTIQIGSRGGPRPDTLIEYYTNVKKVAEISNEGVVKGLAGGFTKIYARCIGINPTTAKKIIYSEDTVNLQVITISGIKIAAPLARFKVDSTVPVWATGIPEALTPLILGSVNPPFRYDWLVEDSDIASVHGVFSATSMEYKPDTQITMRLTGLQIGKTKLFLNVTVPGFIANSNRKEVVFSSSLDVDVFEPLLILSPPGITGIPVLMAPRSTLRLKTNMDATSKLKYSLPGLTTGTSGTTDVQPIIVTVTEEGILMSHNILGYAMVLVTAVDDQGLIHTLNFIVQVKPLHYMMLNLKANFRISSKSPIAILPQGSTFELVVTYHDNTGSQFASGSADLRIRTSRFDLSTITMGSGNTSIVVANKKAGLTMLKAWSDGATKTADYVAFNVAQTVTPVLDSVTTGDIMCLFTPLKLKSSNQFGEWVSSDKNIIRMENDTRIARVLGTKTSHVTLTHSLHSAAPLQIKLLPIETIIVQPYTKPLTNAEGAISEIAIVLQGENMVRKNNLFAGWNCHHVLSRIITSYPYICKFAFTNLTTEVVSSHVFEISPSFNSWTGLYTCDMTPKRGHDATVSTLETNITIWAESKEGGIVSSPLVVPFVPAVYLPSELPINEKTFSTELVIVGLDSILKHVTATAFDSNIIHIGPPDHSKKNMLKYSIRLLDYHWKLDELEDPMSVLVVSKLSEQSVKVHIQTSGVGRPGCGFFYYYRHILTVIISMAIIFFLTFYAYSTYIQPIINVNIHPKRPPSVGDGSAASVRSTPNNQISPFTHTCAAVNYMQRRSGGNPTEPVYGDPNSFYNATTPELRRNRRFM